MINDLELRIYPARKYIMTPENTPKYQEIKKIIDIVMSEKHENLESFLNKIYDQLRTSLPTNNVVCIGKDREIDEICFYAFDVDVNSSYKFGGYNKDDIPYLEMLN